MERYLPEDILSEGKDESLESVKSSSYLRLPLAGMGQCDVCVVHRSNLITSK